MGKLRQSQHFIYLAHYYIFKSIIFLLLLIPNCAIPDSSGAAVFVENNEFRKGLHHFSQQMQIEGMLSPGLSHGEEKEEHIIRAKEIRFRKHKNGIDDSSNGKPVLFLHIGKAGGGTISEILTYNNLTDLVDVWHPQGVLTKKTYLHHQHILINIRDPITRAISAINFDCMPKKHQMGEPASKCCERLSLLHGGQDERCQKRALLTEYFHGSSNEIGEALMDVAEERKKKAKLLVDSFVHTKMSMNEHVGGLDTLKFLVSKEVKFYIVVLDNSTHDFQDQVLYQLKRIIADSTIDPIEQLRVRGLQLPAAYRFTHESFSNYTSTSGAAATGFSSWYAKDYDPIVYLGSIGCGEHEGCKRGIANIVKNRKPHMSNKR